MTYASESDVAGRLGRSLTDDEKSQVLILLADAEMKLKAKIPDLDQKVTDLKITTEAVVMVTASAVARLMRNPDGYVSETDGDYTYQLNWQLSTAELTFTDDEWELLGVGGGGVFMIHPRVRTPFESRMASVDPDSLEYAVWSMNSPLFWRTV